MIPKLRIEDYDYPLTDDRIAKYPLPERDASKLLRYKDGEIDEFIFRDLPSLLPENSLMVFNDTRVVPARLFFQRESGAHIEIFCLEPELDYAEAFAQTESCVWKCIVGNVKRWKGDVLSLSNPAGDPRVEETGLKAEDLGRDEGSVRVRFSWKGGHTFSEILDLCGRIPIPPYLNRETEESDIERYQTLYAKYRGSVAAPTAGLHFTRRVLDELEQKGIRKETICLHVGAGTFLPVKESDVSSHPMHREPFTVKASLIRELRNPRGPVVAVGTTSVRTLESLYYAGVSCIEKGRPEDVGQWDPYTREDFPYSIGESLDALLDYLEGNGLDELKLGTRIIIVPGFRFRMVDVLITNFHQRESTLILLVSAFLDGDWRKVYDYALAHSFRFLSYGDSSLLFRNGAGA